MAAVMCKQFMMVNPDLKQPNVELSSRDAK